MTLAERAAAVVAAIKGQQAASSKAVADAQANAKASANALAALEAEVGDPVALGAALDQLAAIASAP